MKNKSLENLLRRRPREYKSQKIKIKEAIKYISKLGGAKLIDYLFNYSHDIDAIYEYAAGIKSHNIYLTGTLKKDSRINLRLTGKDYAKLEGLYNAGKGIDFDAMTKYYNYSLPTELPKNVDDKTLIISYQGGDEMFSVEENVDIVKKIIDSYDTILEYLQR